jgi:hypothetical protein
LAYAALAAAAILLPRYRAWPLFVVATTTLLLLFDGIHNAWDTVTYVAVHHGGRPKKSAGEKPQQSPERKK